MRTPIHRPTAAFRTALAATVIGSFRKAAMMMRPVLFLRTAALGALLALLAPGHLHARPYPHSTVRMPGEVYLADVDGDGQSEFLQVAGNRLLVTRTNFQKTGVAHLYTPSAITRVIVGRFSGPARDEVCLVLADGTLNCYAPTGTAGEMRRWSTQPAILSGAEEAVVGDFDRNGRDEVLVQNRASRSFRLYFLSLAGRFETNPAFAPGNITGLDWNLRAGDFNGDGRTDLLAFNSAGQVARYDAVYHDSKLTFWWAFTTGGGTIPAGESLSVAAVDDNATEDVVLRNQSTGAVRFFQMQYAGGGLAPLTSVPMGQISREVPGELYWGRFRGASTAPGAPFRDDAMVYNTATGIIHRADAAWDGSRHTYWWAYSQHAPSYHHGWPTRQQRRWLVLMCKMRDVSTQSLPGVSWASSPAQYLRRQFTAEGAGLGGQYDYWRDLSYGTVDMAGSEVRGWYTMAQTRAQMQAMSRKDKINACITAAGVNPAEWFNVVAVINDLLDSGADHTGRVILDHGCYTVHHCTGHELGHGYGLPHAYDDLNNIYGDGYDVLGGMGDPGWFRFVTPYFGDGGPSLNAPNKLRLGWLPANRVATLVPSTTAQTRTLTVAAINRPEANGVLQVKVRFPGVAGDSRYYSVEFRRKDGWDRSIPRETVLIHEYRDGISYLIRAGGGPEWLTG